MGAEFKNTIKNSGSPSIWQLGNSCSLEKKPRVEGVDMACDLSRGRFLWVLSSKILPNNILIKKTAELWPLPSCHMDGPALI